MRSRLISFAFLIGCSSASSVAQPVIQAVPERPRIVVDGYGEVKTPPDLATIEYTIRGEGSTSDDAVRAMTSSGGHIENALRAIDALAEPRTSDVRVTPVKSDDCKEQDYGSTQLSSGPCAVLGYVATQSVTVRTAAVTEAGTMVGLIGRNGGYNAHINRFELRDAREAQRQATAAALEDAALKGAAIAQASKVALGPILSISTVGESEGALRKIIVTGSRLPVLANAPPPIPVKVAPLPITTSANLTVTYAIGR
jgi:uncharacterized protein YggE